MSTEQSGVQEKKKRTRVKYEATLNHTALQGLEGRVLSNFLELVNKVILIDGIPFSDATYKNTENKTINFKLTTGRKDDFLHMIKEYAIIEFIGIKCHIVAVFDKEVKNEIKNAELQKRIDKIKYT